MTETAQIVARVLVRHGFTTPKQALCDRVECAAGLCRNAPWEHCGCRCHRYTHALVLRPAVRNVSHRPPSELRRVAEGILCTGFGLLLGYGALCTLGWLMHKAWLVWRAWEAVR